MSPQNSDGNTEHSEERPISIVDSSRPMMADGRVDVKEERTVEQRGGEEQSGAMGGTMGSLLSLLEAASIMANLKRKSKEQCASTTTQVGKRRAAEEVNTEGGKKKAKVASSVPILPTPRTQRAKNSAPAQPAPAQPKAMGASAKKRKKSSCSGSKRAAAAPGECASVTCVCGYFRAIAWDSRHGRP